MKKATTKATTLTNRDVLDQLADALLRASIEVNAASAAITPDRVAALSESANAAAKAWATKLLELRYALPALVNALNPPTAPKPARAHLRLVSPASRSAPTHLTPSGSRFLATTVDDEAPRCGVGARGCAHRARPGAARRLRALAARTRADRSSRGGRRGRRGSGRGDLLARGLRPRVTRCYVLPSSAHRESLSCGGGTGAWGRE